MLTNGRFSAATAKHAPPPPLPLLCLLKIPRAPDGLLALLHHTHTVVLGVIGIMPGN